MSNEYLVNKSRKTTNGYLAEFSSLLITYLVGLIKTELRNAQFSKQKPDCGEERLALSKNKQIIIKTFEIYIWNH